MTAPIEGPPGPGAGGLDDLATVTEALEQGGPARLAAVVGALRAAVWGLCAVAAATGATALVLGSWAWTDSVPALAVTSLLGLGAVVVPGYIVRRTGALARALRSPAEVLVQAKDLVGRATGSPELHSLAKQVRSRRAAGAAAKARGVSRARRALSTGRMVSAVIGLAQPDPKRHALLVPFTPERLRHLWLAVTVAFWLWLGAAAAATWAFWSLLLRQF